MAGGPRPGEDDVRLHRYGLAIEPPSSEAYAGALRVAKRIHASGGRTIGLLPVGVDTAVPGVALQIGAGLVDILGATIGLVDTNSRWPAFPELGRSGDAGDGTFSTRWLRHSLALLTPRATPGSGVGVAELESLATNAGSLFAHLLVDLTGFEDFGLHLDAVRLLDRVVVIARAASATDWAVVRTCRQIPAWKELGVLLVG